MMQVVPTTPVPALTPATTAPLAASTPMLGAPLAAIATPSAPGNGAGTGTAAPSDAVLRSAFGLLLGAMTRQRPASATGGDAPSVAESDEMAAPSVQTRDEPSAEEPTDATSTTAAAPLTVLREFVMAQVEASTSGPGHTHAHEHAHEPPTEHVHATTAMPAHEGGDAAATAEARVAAAADLRPVRDLAVLHPQLRIRIERVITRMAQEHGHEVRVVETLRSQARQEHLHAQGRTRPGEIVTWTTQSKHTEGLAADLQVDGRWSDADAYARLQRIAQEEGLHTLGPRDAGHVELRLSPDEQRAWKALAGHANELQHRAAIAHQAGPSGAEVPRPGRAHARPAADAQAPRVAAEPHMTARTQAAPVASVAPIAHVAQVGHVAQVAQVATVASTAASARFAPIAPMAVARHAEEHASGADVRSDVVAALAEQSSASSDAQAHTTGAPDAAPRAAVPAAAPAATPAATPAASARDAVTDAALVMHAHERAERVERIEQIHDARASRPLQSLTLRVADADGADHRIRVDLRGGQVVTDIALADSTRVTPLAQRLPELAQRLSEHGYEAGALQVRALAPEPQPAAPWSARGGHDERPTSQHQSQHHPHSRQRGRRDPGGDTP